MKIHDCRNELPRVGWCNFLASSTRKEWSTGSSRRSTRVSVSFNGSMVLWAKSALDALSSPLYHLTMLPSVRFTLPLACIASLFPFLTPVLCVHLREMSRKDGRRRRDRGEEKRSSATRSLLRTVSLITMKTSFLPSSLSLSLSLSLSPSFLFSFIFVKK